MLSAAAFFSYFETTAFETTAAVFIIGCDYSIKVYFFQTKFTSAANLPISPAPSFANFLRKILFPVAR